MTIRNTLVTIVALGTMALTGCSHKNPSWLEADVNHDKRLDVIVFDERGYGEMAFIQKEDGSYDKCKIIERDGVPFYRTMDDKRTYDPWGNVFNETGIVKVGESK